MVISLKDRARGTLLGLAVGDALGTPTEGKTQEQIAAKWGRVTGFLTPEQGGSDDTEYAIFSAKLLLKHKKNLNSDFIADAWRNEIINSTGVYKGAGFSEIITIQNLKKGLKPPLTGQHLHSWSDGLAMRTAPFGIAASGNPELASEFAEIDGSVSHSGEGIYGGKAVAAAVAVAMEGFSFDNIVSSALNSIPEKSWTYSAILRATKIGSEIGDVWSALKPLQESVCVPYYFWSDLAPEAVGLAFGILAAAKAEFMDSVVGSVNVGRDTDTIAAICGAIAGAVHGIQVIPGDWVSRISTARGVCISSVKGIDIFDIADELASLAQQWRNND